jgi:RNA polymerase sigma-70 factor, ECF subfamily
MSPPPDTSIEEELVRLMVAYQAGDLGAFEELYAALADDVRRYFARVHPGAAGDLVQDMFLELHRSRRTYTPPLPVRPWVFGIARNVLARSRRAARQAQTSLDDGDALAAPARDAPSADALDLESALAGLPASTREPWVLHHAFGFSFHSIADRLGVTVMAAKLRSSRATRALRAALRVKLPGGHATGGDDAGDE